MGSILYQILATAIICTMGVNMGIVFTWPASTITLFQSQNTTLNRPMTDTEISLLSSMSSVGALISTPTSGFLLDKLGRKYSSILNSVGLVIVWTILSFTRRVELILTAVFLSGISSSVFLVASVFISEICDASIRGTMTGTNMVAYGLGMLLSYLLGGLLDYQSMLYVGLTLAAAGASSLLLLKESPMYLLSKGLEKEAIMSIAHYKNIKLDSKDVVDEINTLKRALNPDLDDTDASPEEEKLKPEAKTTENISFWKFVKKSQSSRKAFIINLVVMTAAVFQGLLVVQLYAELLFSEAIPGGSPSFCSVMLAVAIAIAGIVAAFLTDLAGRRPLMIYASLGTGISCLILGLQLQLHLAPNWLTALFLYVYPVMYTCGAGTVPFVLVAELFLPEVKSIFSMILVEYIWICNFVMLFIFNPVLRALGWGPVFYIFAGFSFLSAAFAQVFLPETKGLTVEAIQVLFTKQRKVKDLSI